jgi:hypothetical protein
LVKLVVRRGEHRHEHIADCLYQALSAHLPAGDEFLRSRRIDDTGRCIIMMCPESISGLPLADRVLLICSAAHARSRLQNSAAASL